MRSCGGDVAEAGVILPGTGSAGRVLDALARPTTILVGHFGSGKTEIAVNLAFAWRNRGAAATLVDLDVVKPYFRMDETTPEIVLQGVRAARELEAATGIPVRFCAVCDRLVPAFGGPDGAVEQLPILALERHIVPPFAAVPPGVRRRSRVV